jgi:RNA-directed DNA polymerase
MFEQITEVNSLYTAWRKVRANRGSAGIDSVSIKEFERNLQDNLSELSRNLLSNTYQPLPVKFVSIMKKNGKMRELGILTIRDRVAQRAVLDIIEADFESLMKDCSFAFRFGRNVEMAIEQIVVSRANGFWWTVEADIENYFPTINRELLLGDVRKVISDKRVIGLIELWLNAGMLEETWWQTGQKHISHANALVHEAISESVDNLLINRGNSFEDLPISEFIETEVSPFEEEKQKKHAKREAVKGLVKDGFLLAMSHRALLAKILGTKLLGVGGIAVAGLALTPTIIEAYRSFFHPKKGILQGSPMSPVLANVYLSEFDETITKSENKLVRYCDDFVISCKSEADAQKALKQAHISLAKRGLRLHPDKTRILSPTDEFEFLGYKFLSNGIVEPPPTATNEMAKRIKEYSMRLKNQGEKVKNFKVKKFRVKSWKEFFEVFGKKS